MKPTGEQLYEKFFGEPMTDEIRRLADERAKMTPDERWADMERRHGRTFPGDLVHRDEVDPEDW